MNTYKELEKKVIIVAKDASRLMKRRNFTIEQKSTLVNIVTSCDIDVQQYLCKELKKLMPSSGFLCEEKNIRDLNHEYVWIIDPIDGTANYTRGLYEYAISIALVRNNEPVLAVVYNPAQNDLFTAVIGDGAMLNGEPIKVSNASFENSLLCTAFSLYNKDYAPVCIDIVAELYEKCNDIRRFGSCAVELCYLAAGKCDLYFEIRVFPWDYAGAFLILKEAGGILTGWNSEKLLFNKATVLVGANNKENYEKLNAIVNKYLKSVPYKEMI